MMSGQQKPATTPANMSVVWIGRVVSTLPVLGLCASAYFKFAKHPEAVTGMAKFGYSENMLFPLGVLETVCVVLYVIPQTAVLGAVLLTGYLGGAIATHLRINDGFAPPIIIGVLLWLGLVLRDARLRTLLPIRWL